MLYCDANAGSRLRPAARESIRLGLLGESLVGNPSSIHRAGQSARAQLSRARGELLAFLGFKPREAKLIFCSGGTEACNAILRGYLGSSPRGLESNTSSIISSAIEHPAALETLQSLSGHGFSLTLVAPEMDSRCSVDRFCAAVRPDTALVSLMAANNETGALQPIEELARTLRARGYRGAIVSDATQAIGKSEISIPTLFRAGVDAVALSGHKLGAPTGIGAIVINSTLADDRCALFEPSQRGGPQEEGFRGGTQNLLGALALGAVASYLQRELPDELARVSKCRDELWEQLEASIPDLQRITPCDGPESRSLSNTLSIRVPGLRADDLVVALDLRGICLSTGSACASGTQRPSHVILALGYSAETAREVIRISLDWDIDDAATDHVACALTQVIAEMREQQRVVHA